MRIAMNGWMFVDGEPAYQIPPVSTTGCPSDVAARIEANVGGFRGHAVLTTLPLVDCAWAYAITLYRMARDGDAQLVGTTAAFVPSKFDGVGAHALWVYASRIEETERVCRQYHLHLPFLSRNAYYAALILLERACANTRVVVCTANVVILGLIALRVANKYTDDDSFSNYSFASAYGWDAHFLMQMELYFLDCLHWRAHVHIPAPLAPVPDEDPAPFHAAEERIKAQLARHFGEMSAAAGAVHSIMQPKATAIEQRA